MSYEKAMRHARNVRKCRQQRRTHFGFDTGSGRWPSVWSSPTYAARLHIRDWWPYRNTGTPEQREHIRACIREQIGILRTSPQETDA
jgi:hypothetical protein